MRDYLLNLYIRLRYNDEGVTLVEYGVALSIALGVGALVYSTLADNISDAMGAAGTAMPD